MGRGVGARPRALLIVLAAVAMLAVACGGGGGDGGSASGEEGEPTQGGTLRMNIVFDGRSLDPTGFNSLGTSSNDGYRAFALYDSLLQEDSETGEVKPRLFETFESDDSLVWTFTIKEGVQFSDGTPFDAEAVRFNWERQADPEIGGTGLAAMSQVDSMEVVDPLTLRVTLTRPNGQFPRAVAQRLSPVGSPTAIQADPEGFGEHPVGAGPFVLDEWVRDSVIRFSRNDNYWDAPRPYVDALELRVNPDQNQRYQSFAAGEAEMVYVSNLDQVETAEQAGYEGAQFTPSGGRYVIFNTTVPPFDDERARRALTLAWDRDTYAEVVDHGQGVAFETLFAEDSPFYSDADDVRFPDHDADEAQALFDELAEDTGGPLRFELLVSEATRQQGEFLQSSLAGFDNVEVQLAEEPGASFAPRVYDHDYDAAVYATQLIDPEPELYELFRSDSPRNLTGYTDAEFDEALEVGHESQDEAARADAYETVQRTIVDTSIAYWYARWQQWTFYDDQRIGGFETFFDGVPYFERIWLQ
jgi:peptide/nickel transport system substrate-binding protein